MCKFSNKLKIYRILDANINRAKEGLRVCEEITRFALENRFLTQELKKTRHRIDALSARLTGSFSDLLQVRESLKDIGKGIYINELKRGGLADIFFANIQRAKESARVLEEFSKLQDKNLAVEFKKIRYGVYEIEKKAAKKIFALLDNRQKDRRA